MRRGKQLPSGSAEFYFRWLVGVNQEITSASRAHRQFEICGFCIFAPGFRAWIFVTSRRTSLRYAVILVRWGTHAFEGSFNYLIRPCKQVRRNGDANLLGSLEIDRQIEFGRLHES
jgi:hypothetical protein